MNIIKKAGAIAAGAALAAAGLVATAAPASASDRGPLLDGEIYLLNQPVYLGAATSANLVNSGTSAQNSWKAITVDGTCGQPEFLAQVIIRTPRAGVPESQWPEVEIMAADITSDPQGRIHIAGGVDTLLKTDPQLFLEANPAGASNFKIVVACNDWNGNPLGYFTDDLTFTGSTAATFQWSRTTPPALPQAGSATTVAVSDTSIEAGDVVTLTAAVDPAAATGNVEFFAGAQSLGTAALSGGTASLATGSLPVGTYDVTARYLGGSHGASVSAPVSVTVAPVASRPTSATLAVSATSGAAYQAVTLTCTVTAATGAPNGTATFVDSTRTLASVPVTAGAVATYTTNALGAGSHDLGCTFDGAEPYTDSASNRVAASFEQQGAATSGDVVVSIPAGAITITTPYTDVNPLQLGTAVLDPATSTYSANAAFEDIVITDTRAGNLGFTASVLSTDFVGAGGGTFGASYADLTKLVATQVAGNALAAADVVLTDAKGLNASKVFAQYPAGKSVGTAKIDGTFSVSGVPTSVAPGEYRATVTFTAL